MRPLYKAEVLCYLFSYLFSYLTSFLHRLAVDTHVPDWSRVVTDGGRRQRTPASNIVPSSDDIRERLSETENSSIRKEVASPRIWESNEAKVCCCRRFHLAYALTIFRESNYYVSQGRAIRRIVVLYDSIENLITENDRRCDEGDDDVTPESSDLHLPPGRCSWPQLTQAESFAAGIHSP